jgi:hypothetical protein
LAPAAHPSKKRKAILIELEKALVKCPGKLSMLAKLIMSKFAFMWDSRNVCSFGAMSVVWRKNLFDPSINFEGPSFASP